MTKEITLDALAATSKPVEKPKNEVPEVKTETPMKEDKKDKVIDMPKMGSGGFKKSEDGKMIKMDAAQMKQTLIKDGVIEEPKDDTDAHPIVKDAFSSLNETLMERANNVMNLVETMKENKEEEELEAELKEKKSTRPQNYDNNSEDDFIDSIDDEINEDKIEKKEDKKIKTEISDYKFDDIDDKEEELSKEVKKEEPAIKRVPLEDNTEDTNDVDSDNADLDAMLKSLDDGNEDVVDTEEETSEELLEKFKDSMKNVQITQNQIDFKKFTIRQKPISSSFVLNNIQSVNNLRRADWALYHTKKAITFTECLGPELDALRRNMENTNNMNRVISSLKFIYDRVYDNNKPSFEAWTKLIRTEEIDSMYYGIYRACYANSNLIPRTCPSCHKTSLINTDIDSMVVYGGPGDDHEKIKKEFHDILNHDTTTEENAFTSTLLQISDNIAIAYSPATLYSTFVMYSTLRDDITDKYSETLNTMTYIDNFFYIDRETNELIPIEVKEYPGNLNKTVLNKLKVYRGILKGLSNDQYNSFMGKLNSLVSTPKITYVMPACTCPECGAEIPEAPVDSMLNLLFTRAQLARIKSL